MIRPRTNDRPRPRYPLDEDDLLDQAFEMELGGGSPAREDDEDAPPIDLGPDVPHWGNSSPGQPGGEYGGPGPGGLGGSLRTVQTGPNNTMPVSDPSMPRPASGGAGPSSGNRRVPISGRENQANLWGIHNSEVWENADSPDLNRRALRVLMRYAPTSEGLQQAMQDPDWLADPDLARATYDGRDRLNFHGALSAGDRGVPVNEVDVMAAWENGQSQGYRWGDYDEAARQGGGAAPGGDGGGPMGDLGDDMGGGPIDMEAMGGGEGLDVAELSQMDPRRLQELLEQIRLLMDPSQQDALLGGAIEERF